MCSGGPRYPGPLSVPPGPSHESRGGLACSLLRDASTLAVGLPVHIIEAESPVGGRGHGFQVPVQYGGVKEDAPREACFMVWAIWPAISLALSAEQGVVLHYQEG
jgi:hypothetical protein